jgi:hypothetical protein
LIRRGSIKTVIDNLRIQKGSTAEQRDPIGQVRTENSGGSFSTKIKQESTRTDQEGVTIPTELAGQPEGRKANL